jgi:hypothetical protein
LLFEIISSKIFKLKIDFNKIAPVIKECLFSAAVVIVLFFSVINILREPTPIQKKAELGAIKKKFDYTNLFVKSKKKLDSLFMMKKDSVKYNYEDTNITLKIGYLFAKNSKHAVLRYKKNDTIAIISVLHNTKNRWDTIFSVKQFPVSSGLWFEYIDISDFNGDNIPDLKVVKSHWDMHTGENSDLWLFNNDHFTKVEYFDSIVSAEFDKQTTLIYSYMSEGCADMRMYFGTYKIIRNKVIKVSEMDCDCCVDDTCEIKIKGLKSQKYSYAEAYKHVPGFFASGVKEKCEMVRK